MLELLKDYNSQIQYHPKKANVVADALSRKTQHGLNIGTQPDILRDLEATSIELVLPRCTDGLINGIRGVTFYNRRT